MKTPKHFEDKSLELFKQIVAKKKTDKFKQYSQKETQTKPAKD